MPKITYIEHDGTRHELDVALGQTVMEGARDGGVEGILAICGGSCVCSTCHVYVDPDWVDRLPARAEAELETLELAPGVDPIRSRLGCQLRVTESFDGLVVTVPAEQA